MLSLNMESRRLVAEMVRNGLAYLRGLPKAELAKRHQAVKNFVTIGDSLFGWRALAEIESQAAQQVARQEAGIRNTDAINLNLIHTSPEELKMLSLGACAEGACDENHNEIRRPTPVRAQSSSQVPKDPLASKEPLKDLSHSPPPEEKKDRWPAGGQPETRPSVDRGESAKVNSVTPTYEEARLQHRRNCWQRAR
jgi:hypothetical protein